MRAPDTGGTDFHRGTEFLRVPFCLLQRGLLESVHQLRHELFHFVCNSGKNEMPATLSFCFLLFALIFTPAPVKGHYQVTSSGQPVVAAPGDDVILQCLVEPQLDMVDMTVEWSRPDAKRWPKGMEYVHLYRDNREVEDMKSSSYHNRTVLFAGGLRHGNISLIVTNVTTADEGEYKCFIPKLQGNTKSSIVRLVVGELKCGAPVLLTT
uniref:Ig-like domain-containing protein n=1 Tax=Poecilia mexicana TaxID=48701 RepID=A0A3B3YEN4_9TELE